MASKEVLTSIQDKIMKDQKNLDSFIENRKGTTEQVDDVCVIDIRI